MIIKIDDKKSKAEIEQEEKRPDDYDPGKHLGDTYQFRTICPNMDCCEMITGLTNGQVIARELVVCPECGEEHYVSCLAISHQSLDLLREVEQLLLGSYQAFMMMVKQQELNMQRETQGIQKKKFDA